MNARFKSIIEKEAKAKNMTREQLVALRMQEKEREEMQRREKQATQEMRERYHGYHARKNPVEQAARVTFARLTPFVRDVNLKEEIAEKYVPGLVVRMPRPTDVSYKIGGMITSHRYFILSNSIIIREKFDKESGCGHCAAMCDARYKVLGTYSIDGKTAIFLVHLPEESEQWEIIKEASLPEEQTILEKAIRYFKRTYNLPPVPALTTKDWLSLCADPIGIQENGQFFPLEVD
jgi:hypothetical protein